MMSGGRADAERLAIPELSSDLRAYVSRMQQGQSLIEQRLSAAEAAAHRAISEARRELSMAMERLDACRQQEDADCSWAAAAVDRAKLHLETMYGVARDITALRAAHQPAARRFSTALETLGQQVQRELTRAGDSLDVYHGSGADSRSASAGGGTTSTSASSSAGSSVRQPAGFPSNIVMVPLSLIDDSDSRIQGPGEFSEFYTPSDLEWAHEKFTSVVMPGVAGGATIDDFRARDQREGRIGTRSYEMTCAGFFGTDAINLSANGSHFGVNNGYHRIWVARRMGLDAVPARVVGHGAS